jgi:endonuclease/exonuclease/phosphatase family metal-dependent hydrolase
MRIASYNVENLFERPRVLKQESWDEGRALLAAFAQLNDLLQADPYTDEDKRAILASLRELRLLRADESRYVRLRRIRGALLRRSRNGETIVVARGRSSWIGWVELVTEHVDQLAMRHTAMVIRDVGADVLGVIEAESRSLLAMFSAAMLTKVGGVPYETVMLVDGNDPRGIDVGLMCRPDYPVVGLRSHVYDRDDEGIVFSRDCCEYHLGTPSGQTLVVLVNHLKSKGYGSPSDPVGDHRRRRQAVRIGEIYRELVRQGLRYVAVVGDLNDHPTSNSLAPLLIDTDLKDISEHPDFAWNSRLGTFRGGNLKDKFDYVLLSPALFARATGGGIFRQGVYRGPRVRDPWPVYPTLTAPVHEASDHAAIYADLSL